MNKTNKIKKFIKYNNLFVAIIGILLMLILPLKIDIPWISAAVKTGLGRAIVLIVPEGVSVEEFLASLGLAEENNANFGPSGSSINPYSQASEDIVLWLKPLESQKDLSRYNHKVNREGSRLKISASGLLYPTSYIVLEVWTKNISEEVLKSGSYRLILEGGKVKFFMNNSVVGQADFPSDGKVHNIFIGFDGSKVSYFIDGELEEKFSAPFVTLKRSTDSLVISQNVEELKVLSRPPSESLAKNFYNESAVSFGLSPIMEETRIEPIEIEDRLPVATLDDQSPEATLDEIEEVEIPSKEEIVSASEPIVEEEPIEELASVSEEIIEEEIIEISASESVEVVEIIEEELVVEEEIPAEPEPIEETLEEALEEALDTE